MDPVKSSRARSSHTSSTKFLGKFCLNSQIFWKRFNNHNILVTNCEKTKRIVAPVNRKTPNILDERNGYPEFFSLSQAFREISIQEMCRKKTLGFPVYTFPFSDVVLLVARSIAIIQQGPYHPTTSTPLKTSLKKTTLRPLKLFHPYTESPSKKASKVGTKERGQRPSSERDSKIYRLAVPVPSQLKIGPFHVIVVQGRQNMYKKARCTCKAIVLLIKRLMCFRRLPLPSPSPSQFCNEIWARPYLRVQQNKTSTKWTRKSYMRCSPQPSQPPFVFILCSCHEQRQYILLKDPREGEVLPIIAYTGKLRAKWATFSGFRYVKGQPGISPLEVYERVRKSEISVAKRLKKG